MSMTTERNNLMPLATDFFKAKFINAESLQPNVRYEATILSAGPHQFENGEVKLVIGLDYRGRVIALNWTRADALMDGFGMDYDGWVGRRIAFFRGMTTFQNTPKACVVVEPILAPQVTAEQRPALFKPKPDIRSGRGAWDDPAPPAEYDGPNDDPQAA
jgi:hypothetical protein